MNVDSIWYIAKDTSTDFNYYTKRAILSSIYSAVIFHFMNNDNINETILVLDRQLYNVSKIPKIKNDLKKIYKFLPGSINIFKAIYSAKQ